MSAGKFKAFVDESICLRPASGTQEYLICAVLIDIDHIEEVREKLLPLRRPGQIKIHWTAESDSSRRKLTDALAEIEHMSVLITHTSDPERKTERFRRKCLELLYYEMTTCGVSELILESRMDAQNKKDCAHIAELKKSGLSASIRIEHARGGDEPLLWIPDIILGAVNAAQLGKSDYLSRLEDNIIMNTKTAESLIKDERP